MVISRDQETGGRQKVRVVDAENGVVLSEYWEETRGKPSGRPPEGRQAWFLRLYRTNWQDIVLKRRLTFTEAGVLMHLLAFVDWESNWLVHPETGANLNESELAGLLKCDRATLHGSLVALNKKGMIAIVKRGEGCPNHILFNSNVASYGKYMRNLRDHEVFDGGAYEAPVRIKYKEPPMK